MQQWAGQPLSFDMFLVLVASPDGWMALKLVCQWLFVASNRNLLGQNKHIKTFGVSHFITE